MAEQRPATVASGHLGLVLLLASLVAGAAVLAASPTRVMTEGARTPFADRVS